MKKIILLSTALFFSFILNAQVQIGQTLNGESVQLGRSVSISSDGSIIAVGEIGNSDSAMFSGQVRVYENVNNTWIQIGQGINGENELDNLGFTVSLSASGTIIAVGTPFNQDNGSQSGQVRVYENINNVWTQIGQDINGEEGDLLGFDKGTAISADGNIIAVGARRNDENGENSGQVKVFENINNIWTQIGQNINGEAAGDESGSSISISSNGNVIAIGAPNNAVNGNQSGHIRIFENINNSWTQIGQDIDGEEAGDASSFDLSLSSNGDFIVISAPFSDVNGVDSGQVRVFDLSALLSTEESTITQFELFPNPAKDFLNIQLQQGAILENINIYNNLGQFIQSSKDLIVDTSNLAQGIYFVEVSTNQGKSSKKLIIE